MKNALLLSMIVFAGTFANCQEKAKSPHESAETKNIHVRYGRPYMKGREIFGKLVPYDSVYRLGADSATTITFDKDGTFAGKSVKAGTYTLFAITGRTQWTMILNGQLGQWGAYTYKQFKDKDVLQADVPVKTTGTPVEQFTILFSKKNMIIEWDKTMVEIPVSF